MGLFLFRLYFVFEFFSFEILVRIFMLGLDVVGKCVYVYVFYGIFQNLIKLNFLYLNNFKLNIYLIFIINFCVIYILQMYYIKWFLLYM